VLRRDLRKPEESFAEAIQPLRSTREINPAPRPVC
jgi:hypothetical protein